MNEGINKKRIEVIEQVCSSLSDNDVDGGRISIKECYPFVPKERTQKLFDDQEGAYLHEGRLHRQVLR